MSKDVDKFRELAITLWSLRNAEKSKEANVIYKKLKKLQKKMYDKGAMRELSSLMNDEDDHVVYESSCAMLYYDDKTAIINIQNLSRLKGELGFVAESTLVYYNKGELSFWYLK